MFWGWICSYSYYYKWQLVLLHVHYFPGDDQVKCHMMVSETWLCWLEDSDRNEMTGSAHWNKEKVWLLRRQKEKKNKIVTIFLNFLRTQSLSSRLSSVLLSALALQTTVLLQGEADQRQGPNPSGACRPWGRSRPGRASPHWEQRPGVEQRRSPAKIFALWSQGPSLWSLHRSVITGPELSGVLSYLEASDQSVRRFISRTQRFPVEVSCEQAFSVTHQNT